MAASLATTMLTACPWEKEEDKTDDASSVPVTSTDTSQDDDDSTPSEKPSLTITNNGSTITAGGNAVTITTANGSYALTLNQSGDTLTITPTPDEKHTTTAVTASVTSTSQGNLSASWSKDEGATRARTLSVRADTQLNLTTSDNGKNFTLTGIPADATSCTINVTFEDLGYVIESGVYKVHDANGLLAWADVVLAGAWDTDCTLTANIDLAEQNWTPIGNSLWNAYAGTFDGGGHTISNLNVNMQTTNNVGLFGYVNGGTVENLNLANVSVSGNSYVGGIAGDNNNGTIRSCMVSGNVSGVDNVGGVVGTNTNGSNVEGCCFADGSVTASGGNWPRVGGVVGANSGTVKGCCFAGDSVSGTGDDGAYVGGVVGSNYATITGCYWQVGTDDSPSQGVGSGNDGTTQVVGGWSSITDNAFTSRFTVDNTTHKPVPVNIRTSTGNTVVDTVLDAARVFWP